MAAALAAHTLQNRSQADHTPDSPQTRALRAVAENDPFHSAASEIQANTALPVDTTVSVRAYAAHGQARHQTSCPVVEVPSNASLRDLISFSLTVLQEHCELAFNIAFTLETNNSSKY
jgi:hypothetical protein